MHEQEPIEVEQSREHVRCVENIIGTPEAKQKVLIPREEQWVVNTLSHAIIEVSCGSSIKADIAQDCLFITHPGAIVDIPEENNEFRITKKVA